MVTFTKTHIKLRVKRKYMAVSIETEYNSRCHMQELMTIAGAVFQRGLG